MKDLKGRKAKILTAVPKSFDDIIGASEISKATGIPSMSVAMTIKTHLEGVHVESTLSPSGTRKIYRLLVRQ